MKPLTHFVEMTQFRDNAIASLAVAMSQVGYFKGLCMAHGIAYEDSEEALGDIIKGIPGSLENLAVEPDDVVRLKNKTDDGGDYVVHVQRPSGAVVQILIPVKGEYDHYDDFLDEPGCTFGLNFVTKGHYD